MGQERGRSRVHPRRPRPGTGTSSKTELLDATASLREASSGAATLVFDPLRITGRADVVRWSPIAGCQDPVVAIRRADALMAGMDAGGLSDSGFFRSAGSMLLRVVLHAAALDGAGVTQVRTWVGNPHDPALEGLIRSSAQASAWMADLTMMTLSAGRTLQSIALTTAVALSCLAVPDVADICSPPMGEGFDPGVWLAAGGGTLHVVAPDAEAASVAPLTAALVDEVMIAARAAAVRAPSGRLDPPLRMILDELPNICPLPKLDAYLSDAGGRGIQVIWMAQARSQLDDVFGPAKARTIVAATGVMLWSGGQHDPDLLRDLSGMLGDVEERIQVRSRGPGGSSWGEHVRHVPVMQPADLFALPAFQALLLAGAVRGALVRLPRWWDRPDADRIQAAKMAVGDVRARQWSGR